MRKTKQLADEQTILKDDVVNNNEHILSASEQFYLASNRNSTDEEVASVLELEVDYIKRKREELKLSFEKKTPSIVDLKFNDKLLQWEDSDGNIYNGPAIKADDVKETVEIKKQIVAGIKAGDLIGRNDKKTVAVMTGEASQMSDITKGSTKRIIASCVHQPKTLK